MPQVYFPFHSIDDSSYFEKKVKNRILYMNGSVKAIHALAFQKIKSSGRKFDRSGVYEFYALWHWRDGIVLLLKMINANMMMT